MKKVLAFGASTSSTSINKKLATFTGENLKQFAFDVIDLNNFTMPFYSEDEEKKNGFPEKATLFSNLFEEHDGFIISLAEHNGSYAAVFKNMFDWATRIERKIFRQKPLLLMATSPGTRGGISVLEHAVSRFSRHGAKAVISYSLPNFYENFKGGQLINTELLEELKQKIAEFEQLV